MLKLTDLKKSYGTGDGAVWALKGVSLEFKDSEFVAVLGPSGCGKTTFLNIVGGLDRYTSGDLVINGVSTKEYDDKQWDAYRNNTIGFVFQSYNLIGHQTVLDNVALSLTLSGVSPAERKERALEALDSVGIKDQAHKRPNQLSGGQMQRVAIARALVNNPDVILADEPTGALDSSTSEQIMNILQEVAKDRLVIMVTHNADLAKNYATRIVKFKDGLIIEDNANKPTIAAKGKIQPATAATKPKKEKTSMSYLTALKLSFKNLLTKKTRTILTAFAGSIGIIGIALVMSISNGMNIYIDSIQREMLAGAPIQIGLTEFVFNTDGSQSPADPGYIIPPPAGMLVQHTNNFTTDFVNFVRDEINPLTIGQDTAIFRHDTGLNIWYKDTTNAANPIIRRHNLAAHNSLPEDLPARLITLNELPHPTLMDEITRPVASVPANFTPPSGAIPITMVINANRSVDANVLELITGSRTNPAAYSDLLGTEFRLVHNDRAIFWDVDRFSYVSDQAQLLNVWNNHSTPMFIQNIVTQNPDTMMSISQGLYFRFGMRYNVLNSAGTATTATQITNHIIPHIVTATNANQPINVTQLFQYVANLQRIGTVINAPTANQLNTLLRQLGVDLVGGILNSSLTNAQALSAIESLELEHLINAERFITGVDIYPSSFENRQLALDMLAQWNEDNPENRIRFTDVATIVANFMRELVNILSIVLSALSGVSLVVSTIMIGIITYVSVIERTKEIGILRSIGARKKDIRRVFSAEAIIIGFVAGVIGIAATLLLNFPINAIIYNFTDVAGVARLAAFAGIGLIALSMLLTFVAGLIPSRIAAKRDPVVALRTE